MIGAFAVLMFVSGVGLLIGIPLRRFCDKKESRGSADNV